MKFTLKENINLNSVATQHEILLRATNLLVGREGALETEKELYLILAIVGTMINEDVIAFCNEDNRDLFTVMQESIEPFFIELRTAGQVSDEVYNLLKDRLLKRCQQIWDNQHSVVGLIDSLLLMIGSMSEEDKKDALVKTAEIAGKVYEHRTEVLEKEAQETNSRLEEFVKQYQSNIQIQKKDNANA